MAPTKSLVKEPAAFLPIAMSLAALALIVGYVAIFGVPKQPQEEEGTGAHLWQLLMGGQVPIVAFFVIKWFPEKTKQAIQVLVLQAAVFFASLAALFFFEHVLQ